MFPANLQLHFQHLQKQQQQQQEKSLPMVTKPPRPLRKDTPMIQIKDKDKDKAYHENRLDDNKPEEELNLLSKEYEMIVARESQLNELEDIEVVQKPLNGHSTNINDDKRQMLKHFSTGTQVNPSGSTSSPGTFDSRNQKKSTFATRFNFARFLPSIDDDSEVIGEFLSAETKASTTSTSTAFARFNGSQTCCDSCRPLPPPMTMANVSMPSSPLGKSGGNTENYSMRFLPAKNIKRSTSTTGYGVQSVVILR